MQAEKQQRSWKIDVHAKVKNFRFKIKATTAVPTWEFRRCSIFLKLGKYFLRLNSEYGPAIILRREVPKTRRSKFLGFLRKFCFLRRHKNRVSHQEENRRECFAYKVRNFFWITYSASWAISFLYSSMIIYLQDLICMGSLVVVAPASLFQFVCNKERKGIIALCSVISLYLALLFKKYIGKRIINFFVLLMVATLVSSLVFDLDHSLEHYGLQLVWNYVVSSGLPGTNFFSHFFFLFF